jgi:predicted dehydrogenase
VSGELKVGIAGYGVVGKRRRAVIDAHPAFKTVAVSDIRLDGDGHFEDGVRYADHYKKLFDATSSEVSLDVLFVCLPNDVAPGATIGGLERGLHVFCEKPPGRDLADIARVISTEKRHPGLKLKYGFNHRYHDSVRDALTLVRSGELGRIINLRGVYGKSTIINFESDWRTKRAQAGGGILLDQGIHMVDLLRLFAGEFTDIHSVISNDFWHHDVEDNAYALMRTYDGVVAMLHSSATQWRHRFNLEIALEKGTIILAGLLTGSKSYGVETLTVARATEHDAGDPKEQTTHYDRDPSWVDEIAEFADAITADKAIVNGSSEEALRTMELVYRIYCADPEWKAQWKLSQIIPEQ